jgi:hypothetical protein
MKWPWVSRKTYETETSTVRLKALIDTDNLYEQIERLDKEISFWREKFEKEQARADRAVDSLIAQNGQPPISEESRTDRVKISDAMIEMQHQVGEIFGDVENSVLSVENDPSTQASVEEYKEPTPEEIAEDRKQRLAVIAGRISAKNAEKEASAVSASMSASENVATSA